MLNVLQESVSALPDYARIPIAFQTWYVLDVDNSTPKSNECTLLHERRLDAPFIKDYDCLPSNRPTN
jgi:hypothetical protein